MISYEEVLNDFNFEGTVVEHRSSKDKNGYCEIFILDNGRVIVYRNELNGSRKWSEYTSKNGYLIHFKESTFGWDTYESYTDIQKGIYICKESDNENNIERVWKHKMDISTLDRINID